MKIIFKIRISFKWTSDLGKETEVRSEFFDHLFDTYSDAEGMIKNSELTEKFSNGMKNSIGNVYPGFKITSLEYNIEKLYKAI